MYIRRGISIIRLLPVLLLLVISGCGLLRWGIDIKDFSGFDLFTYTYQNALGFPELDMVSSTRIEKLEPGRYECEMSYFGAWEAGMDSSGVIWWIEPPLTAIPVETRILSDSEVRRMKDLFENVEIRKRKDPQCLTMSIDPPWILSFRWDDYRITDYVCNEPRLEWEQSGAIMRFLESLMAAGIRSR